MLHSLILPQRSATGCYEEAYVSALFGPVTKLADKVDG